MQCYLYLHSTRFLGIGTELEKKKTIILWGILKFVEFNQFTVLIATSKHMVDTLCTLNRRVNTFFYPFLLFFSYDFATYENIGDNKLCSQPFMTHETNQRNK